MTVDSGFCKEIKGCVPVESSEDEVLDAGDETERKRNSRARERTSSQPS